MNTMESRVWITDRLEELRVQLETLSPDSAEYKDIEAHANELRTHLSLLAPLVIPV